MMARLPNRMPPVAAYFAVPLLAVAERRLADEVVAARHDDDLRFELACRTRPCAVHDRAVGVPQHDAGAGLGRRRRGERRHRRRGETAADRQQRRGEPRKTSRRSRARGGIWGSLGSAPVASETRQRLLAAAGLRAGEGDRSNATLHFTSASHCCCAAAKSPVQRRVLLQCKCRVFQQDRAGVAKLPRYSSLV